MVKIYSLVKSELQEEVNGCPPPIQGFGSPPNPNLTCQVTSIMCPLIHRAGGLNLRDTTGWQAVQG